MNSAAALAVICPAADIAIATGDAYARAMREDADDLWPKAPRGRGSNRVPVRVHHMANLLFALTDTPINAAAAVRQLRTLAPAKAMEWRRNEGNDRVMELGRIVRAEFHYATLAEMVENTLWMLASVPAEQRETIAAEANRTQWSLSLSLSGLGAWVTRRDDNGLMHTVEFEPTNVIPGLLALAGALNPSALNPWRTKMRRVTTFPFALLVVAAGIVADTVALERAELPFETGLTAAGRENAAPTGAALTNQQPHTKPPGDFHTPEGNGARERRQPLSADQLSGAAGNSTDMDERPPDDRPYPFDAAAA